MTTLYLVSCGAIFWSAFCRLVMTGAETRRLVRAAFVLLGGAAGFGVMSVLFGEHRPDAIEAVLTAAYALVLAVSSVQWRHGVPLEYRQGEGERCRDGDFEC